MYPLFFDAYYRHVDHDTGTVDFDAAATDVLPVTAMFRAMQIPENVIKVSGAFAARKAGLVASLTPDKIINGQI